MRRVCYHAFDLQVTFEGPEGMLTAQYRGVLLEALTEIFICN